MSAVDNLGFGLFIAFWICIAFAMLFAYIFKSDFNKKAVKDGKRYSQLMIYRTIERDHKVLYVLGDESYSIEVEKEHYDTAIDRYNQSMKWFSEISILIKEVVMKLKKLEVVVSLAFSIMIFVLFGMFLFEDSIQLNGFFFTVLYILAGANIFLITYNRNGKTSKIIAYSVAFILLAVLMFYLIFVMWVHH